MATLYKRANLTQRRIMRAVEGAVIDAINSHPAWECDRRLVKSIAKRAAGTMSADVSYYFADKLAEEHSVSQGVVA